MSRSRSGQIRSNLWFLHVNTKAAEGWRELSRGHGGEVLWTSRLISCRCALRFPTHNSLTSKGGQSLSSVEVFGSSFFGSRFLFSVFVSKRLLTVIMTISKPVPSVGEGDTLGTCQPGLCLGCRSRRFSHISISTRPSFCLDYYSLLASFLLLLSPNSEGMLRGSVLNQQTDLWTVLGGNGILWPAPL